MPAWAPALPVAPALAHAAALAPAAAWADHPGALRSAPVGNPILEALVWAGAAFLVGVAIVAIVAVLAPKRTPSEYH
jgi:hypothetical protein